MSKLEEILQEVIEEENNKNYNNAILILEEAMQNYSELYIDLLYELAMLHFRNGFYYLSLIKLIEVYRLFESDMVLNFIFEAFVYPNKEIFENNYNNNMVSLERYPLIYTEVLPDNFESIDLKIVWYDKENIIYYISGQFIEYKNKIISLKEIQKDCNLFLMDLFYMDNILEVEKLNLKIKNYISETLFLKNPLFLYYDPYNFIVFLCINNVELLLKRERIVFLIGKDSLDEYFGNLYTVLPNNIIWNIQREDVIIKIREVIENRVQKNSYLQNEGLLNIKKYYKENKELIIEHIKLGHPKIFFLTSRYTTALQYHAKNLYRAAIKKGLDAHMIIEKTCVDVVSWDAVLDEIEKLKPDIFVLMNHFCFENEDNILPREVVYLTWVQDPFPNIMNKKTPSKMSDNDFILNHFISWKDFFDVGYDTNKIIDAPIPGNQDIYKPYEIMDEEKVRYCCDICLVSHSSAISIFLEDDLKKYTGESREIVENLYLSYYKQVLEKESILYSKQQFREFIDNYTINQWDIRLSEKNRDSLVDKMFGELAPRVYRQVMVQWLLSAGYTNIKLWGNGWEKCEEFIPYAMGPAENGEELSKILQVSKIVLGTNSFCTGTARVWETMLNGGFYLSNYIPEEYDCVDIRKILQEDDFVMFKSKSELLDKIEYYLNNEEERFEMARRGRAKALEKMTFDILIDKILQQLNEKL